MNTSTSPNNTKTVGIILIMVLGFAIVGVFIVGYFVAGNQPQQGNDDPIVLDGEPIPTETVKIPFDYTVVSVSTSTIVLEGKNGGMEIPADENVTAVYHVGDNSLGSINDLQAGQTVSLRIIPGEKAWIGIE